MSEPEILFFDEELIVCVKPAGFLSERGSGKNLPDALAPRFGEIRTVHRLDKNVGGVMAVARTGFAAASLIGQIQRRETEKEYLAVVRGVPPEAAGTMTDLLFHDAGSNKTFVVERKRKGVREAVLHYAVLQTKDIGGEPCSLVRIRLETGRTHQIRVQFASRRLPLLGDIRYGSKAPCEASLWAFRLAFSHPKTKKRESYLRLPPDAFPWNEFDITEEKVG